MQLIDTHTHLYLPEFDADRDEMIERAVSSGVSKLLMPNIDVHSVKAMLSAADSYKNICYPMSGLHPTSVGPDYLEQLEILERNFQERKYIAVGEIGIDLYWDKSFLKEQIAAMKIQVAFALDHNLPVAIHSRDAFPEVFSVLDEFKGSRPKGVLHAFSGTIGDAEKAIKMGFMIGIGGPLTFKNSGLAAIVKEVGIKNVILETDSPYLAPAPLRGKRNESSYICIVNKKLAEICGIDERESASITSDNSCKLFNI